MKGFCQKNLKNEESSYDRAMLGISQAQKSKWFCSPAVVDSICHPRHISPSSPIRDESCTSLGISQAVRQRTLTPPRGGSNPSSPTKLKSFGLRTAHFVRVDSEWDSLTLPPHPQPIPHLSPSWRFFISSWLPDWHAYIGMNYLLYGIFWINIGGSVRVKKSMNLIF